MYIVGIDPGVNGYVAVVEEEAGLRSTRTDKWELFKMPIKKDDNKNIIDVRALREKIGNKPAKVFIEQPPMMRIPGIKSLMTISENYGRILAVLEMEEYAYQTVLPTRWQAFLLSKAGMKKEKALRGKAMALEIVKKLFPHEKSFQEQKVHDGLVDAVLMAKYGSYVCGPL
jgi:hypothetical protein